MKTERLSVITSIATEMFMNTSRTSLYELVRQSGGQYIIVSHRRARVLTSPALRDPN